MEYCCGLLRLTYVQALADRKSLSKFARAALWLCVLGVASSCATTQLGIVDAPVSVAQPQAVVLFDWHPKNESASSGTMSATLSDGTHYHGQFFKVAKHADPSAYAPAWDGWSPYWSEWTGVHDWPTFEQQHNNEVIANFLASGGRQRLRCRFELTQPSAGLSAGASGVCQSSANESIDGVVLPRS